MINYDEINDFIIKVFNYYNGKINVINKATLDINWANLMMCNAGGYSRLPNIVIVNPMVIYRFYNYNEFIIKANIIETIIHELYHTDQLINYTLYISDVNYTRFIENACEIQTALYMIGHIQEIYNAFGIDLGQYDKIGYNKFMARYSLPGIRYQRRYYYDHIFMCIDDICNLDQQVASRIYNFIKDNVNTKNDIIININGERIDVCFNGNLMPIDEFNTIISKYVCTGVHGVKHEIKYYKDSSDMIINIETKILNLMCKKV